MQFENLDAALAGMSERLQMLGVSPLWMLHETASADSAPTYFQRVLNRLLPREDGVTWAGPGIVTSAGVDLESLEADKIWRPVPKEHRETAEIEQDLVEAKAELKEALQAAAAELWAQRDTTSRQPVEGDETSPAPEPEADQARVCPKCGGRSKPDAAFCTHCGAGLQVALNCHGCGAERESDGNFCPYCGSRYEVNGGLDVTDLRNKRKDEPGSQPGSGNEETALAEPKETRPNGGPHSIRAS